jgi:hypothetical protein
MLDAKYETPACSAKQVLERMTCLGYQLILLYQEQAWGRGKPEERDQLAQIYEFFSRHLLADRELSPDERVLVAKPIGSWTVADRMNVGWRMECVVVMAWALALVDAVPPFDQMAGDWEILESFNTPSKVEALKQTVTLRPAAELDGFLTEAERWHWCARQVEPYVSKGITDRQRVTMRTALGAPVSLYGESYHALSFDQFSRARSIAMERHRAINWIWDGEPWDEVTTDT